MNSSRRCTRLRAGGPAESPCLLQKEMARLSACVSIVTSCSPCAIAASIASRAELRRLLAIVQSEALASDLPLSMAVDRVYAVVQEYVADALSDAACREALKRNASSRRVRQAVLYSAEPRPRVSAWPSCCAWRTQARANAASAASDAAGPSPARRAAHLL